jgi:hypothetical protein
MAKSCLSLCCIISRLKDALVLFRVASSMNLVLVDVCGTRGA